MALDEATTAMLERLAAQGGKLLHQMEPSEARAHGAALAAMAGAGPEVLRVEDRSLTGGDGGTFEVRAHVPSGTPAGVVVYYHGGGWVIGDIDEYDSLGRRLAARTDSVVVLVNYRKSPEYPYPTAVEDAWRALTWADENVAKLAGGRVPLVVAGDSAGGNLAAVMALRARNRSGPEIALQVLIYPVTDADPWTPSYQAPENQLMLRADDMVWFWDHYCPPGRRDEPEASPLRATDHRGLPPAVVLIAEHDVLRSEGEAYASRLRESGVAVDERLFEGQMHGFLTMLDLLPASAAGVEHLSAKVSAALAGRS